MKEKYAVIFCTTPSKEVAKELSKKLLNENLIACSTIIPAYLSIYKWQGKVCEEEEFLCIFKTKVENYEKIEKIILKSHPYEVPEIILLEIKKGFEKYLNWINESLI
ncbi:MAG: divalent-cation tolerance protein CutA [Thermoanaerobaculia bacterium]